MTPPQETKTKLTILRKYLPLLAAMPYTRLIFLSGSVANGTARTESDIDLIIVSRKNRVWLNRIFLETAAWLIGRRRTKTKFKNRFCFNMFLSDDLPLLPHRDNVAAGYYKNLRPAWSDDNEQIKKFWDANNWVQNFYPITASNQPVIFPALPRRIEVAKMILEKFLDWSGAGFLLEKIFFKLQYSYIKSRFDSTGGIKNQLADFFASPSLIAYHFPVSNYHRELRKTANKFRYSV